uniref:Transporter n=1 Tax=Parastrongyloides trichosuri TaxID=131310 RepID=A0A0N4ZNM4_PARTI
MVSKNKKILTPEIGTDKDYSNHTKVTEEEPGLERGDWGGRIYFVLTAVGCAVGLGNIWRFPYVAYENGGSAFLIPYFLTSLLIGIPLLHFEMNYGQFAGSGCGTCFRKIMPAAQGVGWVMLLNSFFVGIFYIMVMAYILIYLFTIAIGQGYKYSSCDNPWNTLGCISSAKDLACVSNTTLNIANYTKAVFLNNTCYFGNDTEEIKTLRDGFFRVNKLVPVSATEEFFDRYVLQRTDSFENLGEVNGKLLISLLFCWALIFLFAWKGVKVLGKIAVFTALYPYVVVVTFLFMVTKMDGAYEGMKYYLLEPDFSRLYDYKTWLTAATQLIFSFSIGMGNMHTLASYNKKNHNVFIDVGIISVADIFMSIVGGAVVFSVLGFLANKTGKIIPEVVSSGTTLAFVVYPEATSLMPMSEVFAFAYFLMLFLLGASTEVCYIDLIATSLYDTFKTTRKHRTIVVLSLCILMFCCGLIFCFSGGVYYFTIFNEYATGFNITFVLVLQLLVVTCFYGINNYIEDIRSMIGKPKSSFANIIGPTGSVMKYLWLYVTPALCIAVCGSLIYSFITFIPSYGVGKDAVFFPPMARYIGYSITFSTILPVFIFFIVNFCTYAAKKRSMKKLFKPTIKWPSYGREKKQLQGSLGDDSQGSIKTDSKTAESKSKMTESTLKSVISSTNTKKEKKGIIGSFKSKNEPKKNVVKTPLGEKLKTESQTSKTSATSNKV